jgi:hypothetical protein
LLSRYSRLCFHLSADYTYYYRASFTSEESSHAGTDNVYSIEVEENPSLAICVAALLSTDVSLESIMVKPKGPDSGEIYDMTSSVSKMLASLDKDVKKRQVKVSSNSSLKKLVADLSVNMTADDKKKFLRSVAQSVGINPKRRAVAFSQTVQLAQRYLNVIVN